MDFKAQKGGDVDVSINVAKIELYLMNIINKGDFKSRDKDQQTTYGTFLLL
jgi:hypothetical protein